MSMCGMDVSNGKRKTFFVKGWASFSRQNMNFAKPESCLFIEREAVIPHLERGENRLDEIKNICQTLEG